MMRNTRRDKFVMSSRRPVSVPVSVSLAHYLRHTATILVHGLSIVQLMRLYFVTPSYGKGLLPVAAGSASATAMNGKGWVVASGGPEIMGMDGWVEVGPAKWIAVCLLLVRTVLVFYCSHPLPVHIPPPGPDPSTRPEPQLPSILEVPTSQWDSETRLASEDLATESDQVTSIISPLMTMTAAGGSDTSDTSLQSRSPYDPVSQSPSYRHRRRRSSSRGTNTSTADQSPESRDDLECDNETDHTGTRQDAHAYQYRHLSTPTLVTSTSTATTTTTTNLVGDNTCNIETRTGTHYTRTPLPTILVLSFTYTGLALLRGTFPRHIHISSRVIQVVPPVIESIRTCLREAILELVKCAVIVGVTYRSERTSDGVYGGDHGGGGGRGAGKIIDGGRYSWTRWENGAQWCDDVREDNCDWVTRHTDTDADVARIRQESDGMNAASAKSVQEDGGESEEGEEEEEQEDIFSSEWSDSTFAEDPESPVRHMLKAQLEVRGRI